MMATRYNRYLHDHKIAAKWVLFWLEGGFGSSNAQTVKKFKRIWSRHTLRFNVHSRSSQSVKISGPTNATTSMLINYPGCPKTLTTKYCLTHMSNFPGHMRSGIRTA